jgi:FkbM family methyltransferase
MSIRLPWSLSFLRKMLPYVGFVSALRLRKMVLREGGRRAARQGLVQLWVKNPFRASVWLREPGSDLDTFREVVMKSIYQQVVERIGECEYVLDLGANIGLTSLYLASVFPTCRILAVEPSPENVEMLTLNVSSLVTKGRCQICSGAVWWQDATVDLSPPPNGTAYHAIKVSGDCGAGMQQPAPAYTVETLMKLAGFPRVDILKIDVEGAETEIFRGPIEWLSRVNAIAIEFHGESRQTSNFDAVVAAFGFVVEEDRYPNTVVAYRSKDQRVQ